MRLTTERLAEQVRSDVLELALLVARRIVETELSANIEPLFRVIRTVVRRAGESRRIIIHLCPEDAIRVEVAGGAKAVPGTASVEIMPDHSLSAGDCVVEADFGTVDGRIDTRMEELRRILAEAIASSSGGSGGER
jgi:flagellar assembly protein FliH